MIIVHLRWDCRFSLLSVLPLGSFSECGLRCNERNAGHSTEGEFISPSSGIHLVRELDCGYRLIPEKDESLLHCLRTSLC